MHTTRLKHSGCANLAQLPVKRPLRCSCRVQAVQSSKQSGKKPSQQADCDQDRYPHEDSSKDDGFFPRREPGAFPAVRVKGFWGKAKDKLGFTAAEEAESTGIDFDPLRDGPLRYLGYANECGSVFPTYTCRLQACSVTNTKHTLRTCTTSKRSSAHTPRACTYWSC